MVKKGNEIAPYSQFEGFTIEQWRFIAARLGTSTDKAAAEQIGVHYTYPSKWENKQQINEAIELLARDSALGAVDAIKQQSIRAVMTIAKLLDSPDEAIRLRAAQDLLDRAIGKATQRSEISGKDGGAVPIRFIDYGLSIDDDDDDKAD